MKKNKIDLAYDAILYLVSTYYVHHILLCVVKTCSGYTFHPF